MKKKISLLMVLVLLIAGRAFAQFTVDGAVSTSFNGITPSIGIGVEFSKLDLLAGLNFRISNRDDDDGSYDYSSNIGFYIGLAPKTSLSGKWSISFPICAEITSGSRDSSLSLAYIYHYFNFYFKAGARATFSFSNHWGLYTGFLVDIVSSIQYEYDDYYANTFNVFNGGVVQLGIIYRFNPKNNYTGGSSENDDWW